MESIVNAIIGPTLSNFIKDYKKEQLSLSLLSGTGKITNIELIGSSIQALLLIPPTIEITKASCDLFEIKVPYTDMNRQPITITMGKMEIILEEPEVVKAINQDIDSKMKTGNAESATGFNAIKNVCINISEINFYVRTRGGFTYHSNYQPGISAHMQNISVYSCDAKWQRLDNVSGSPVKDVERGVLVLRKRITVAELDVRVRMTADDEGFSLLERMPLEVRSITEFRVQGSVWIGSRVQLCLDTLMLSLDQDRWQRISELAFALQAAMRREVPQARSAVVQQQQHDSSTNRIRYGVQVATAHLELLTGRGGGDEGLSLLGQDLKLVLEPKRRTQYTVKDLSYRGGDQQVPCWESQLHAFVGSVVLKERRHRAEKEFPLVLSQSQGERPLGKVALCYRTEIEAPDEALRRRVPEFEVDCELNGFRAVLDQEVWRSAYAFLIEGPLLGGLSEGADAIRKRVQAARAAGQDAGGGGGGGDGDGDSLLKKTVVFNVRLLDTEVILPPVVDADVATDGGEAAGRSLLKDSSLHLILKKAAATNQPDWPFPPFLSDALRLLPEKREALTPAEGTVQKFQAVLEGLTLEYRRRANTAERYGALEMALISPVTLKAYGRYFPPRQTGVAGVHRLELSAHLSALSVKAPCSQCLYLYRVLRHTVAWVGAMVRDERERQRVVALLSTAGRALTESQNEAAESLRELDALRASASLDDPRGLLRALKRQGAERKAKAQALASGAAKGVLERLALTCFARLERVLVELPAPGAWIPGKDDGGGDLEALIGAPACATARDHLLARGEVELCECVVDNSLDAQAGCARVKALRVDGVDHASLPAALRVGPCEGLAAEKFMLQLSYLRRRARAGDAGGNDGKDGKDPQDPAQGWARGDAQGALEGLDAVAVLKPHALARGAAELWPELRALARRARAQVARWRAQHAAWERRAAAADEAQRQVQEAVEMAGNVVEGGLESLLYSWGVVLGNCCVRYAERREDGTLLNRGAVTLSTGNQEAMNEALVNVEDQLIQTRLQLAQCESEKFDMQAQVDKLKTTQHALEEGLAKANLAMADALTENDAMKSKLRAAARGPSSSSGRRK